MVKIRITPMYCLAFYFLTMLYSSLHELVHHFVGFIVCGEWGYKTFNYFSTACDNTRITLLATYAGPLFTFIMMWVGAAWLKGKNTSVYVKQLAFALIFTQMPLQRMVMCFFKMNDEYFATSQLLGRTPLAYWLVIIVVWLCCVPPLLTAYKSIANKSKMWWFLFYLFLFPYLLWGPIFMLLEYLLVNKHVLSGTIIGIANLFILNEVVTIIGFMLTKKHLNSEKYSAKESA
jgi:hypothetical protein